MPIFSWSALVLGSTAWEMTGSGKTMRSRMMTCAGSDSVSPVVTSLMPTAAAMSPAMRPSRSFLPLIGLKTESPDFTTPEPAPRTARCRPDGVRFRGRARRAP
ncbi:hypothetical protein G6F65_022438 [Rhizopus arrhizus]|nr:hypothetical protein G6F65_022438 [Rhizopus arrhizus]